MPPNAPTLSWKVDGCKPLEDGCPWDETSYAAAGGGHLEVLKWARVQLHNCPFDRWTCASAAEGGHLDVLKWLREVSCPWDAMTCQLAAAGGHLAVLQWAREHDCPWDENTCHATAVGGHLEVLQWAVENGCPWDGRDEAFVRGTARMFRHQDMLTWLDATGE